MSCLLQIDLTRATGELVAGGPIRISQPGDTRRIETGYESRNRDNGARLLPP